MAYEKNDWQTGDVITAEKLNNIENGVEAASPCVVHLEVEGEGGEAVGHLDKTAGELMNAVTSGIIPTIIVPYGGDAYGVCTLQRADIEAGVYSFILSDDSVYYAENAEDKPSDQQPETPIAAV